MHETQMPQLQTQMLPHSPLRCISIRGNSVTLLYLMQYA